MTFKSSPKLIQLDNIIAETALVAMIRQEPAEISRINNLEFKESYDNLDYLVYAVLPLSLGSQASLVRHKHSPDPGIEVCVRHGQKDIARVLNETIYQLGLDRNDLTWILPEYKRELDELIQEQLKYQRFLCEHIGCSARSDFDPSKDLSGKDLSELPLKGIQLGRANLNEAKFIKSELGFAYLREANLESANLQEADLRSANLQKAILLYANLENSYLQEADLQSADIQLANLQRADLRGANLQHANLKGSDLRGANLERANLKSADLSLAQLDNATFLKGADVEDANLKDVQWDGHTMWFNIIGLHKANGVPNTLKNHSSFKLGIKLSEGIEELSENNNLEQFRKTYKQVLVDIDDKEVAASLWNKIAWLSCLYGYPDEECYQAALNAVELVGYKGNYHDTLGMVLGLRGEYHSAIDEFEIALESDDVKHWLSDFKKKRSNWIEDLKLGKNPFNENVMEALRIEER